MDDRYIERMTDPAPSLRIKLRLLELGLTITSIADAIGQHRTAVSQVIHGHAATPSIRRGVSEQLSMTYLDLWGEEDPGVDHLRPGRKPLTLVSDSCELIGRDEVADVA
jgi:hypothetical protein